MDTRDSSTDDLLLPEDGFAMNPLNQTRTIRILPVKGPFELDEEGVLVNHQRYAVIVEDVDSFENT